MATKCYQSLQGQNSERNKPSIYSSYHYWIYRWYHSKISFKSNQLRTRCILDQSCHCFNECSCIFKKCFFRQEKRIKIEN